MKITFLGHRLQDLGGFEDNPLHQSIKNKIKEIIDLHSKDKIIILTGLNIGIEMWAAEIARECEVPYHVYVPFADPHSKWPFPSRKTYSDLLKHAKKRITLDDGPFEYKKMIAKELKMIEDSDNIYSFFKESVPIMRKAQKLGKNVIASLPVGEDDDFFISI